MALTSLPMPSYMPKEEIYGYSWAGARLGNTYTCNAQGFFATFGTMSMLLFNTMLCLYYACAIAFTMQEKTIKKYVEPFIHGIPIVTSLGFAITPLFHELYNPSITAFAWCATFTYPLECIQYDYLECERGNRSVMTSIVFAMLVLVPLDFVIIVTSLLLVIIKVIRTERLLAKMVTSCNHESNQQEFQHMRLRHGNTKAVLVQALCYISAFLLALMLPLLRLVGYLFFGTADDTNLYGIHAAMDKAGLVFYPLQGLFNFLIFLSFKVYNYKRFSPDTSIFSILRLMFTSSAQDPAFISRISIVKINEEDQPSKSADDVCYKVQVSDEKEDERHFRLGLLYTNSNDDVDALEEEEEDRLSLQEDPLGLHPEEVTLANSSVRDEMRFRLGLFHEARRPLHVVNEEQEEEEELSSSAALSEYIQKQNKLVSIVSSAEISNSSNISSGDGGRSSSNSRSSSGDTYHFYPGVLEDSKAAMLKQPNQQGRNFVSSKEEETD
jgi:hypothetical protein